MIPLNYHHLYYFYVIAKEGSITKARSKLLLAQPTLSAQLKQLERSLGKELFVRRGRRLLLTQEGRRALDFAESIFELGRELQSSLRAEPVKGQTHLRLAAIRGFSRAYLHSFAMAALRFGAGRIFIEEDAGDDLLSGLSDHQYDIVLTDERPVATEERFTSRLVGSVPIVLAAVPTLARRVTRPQHLDQAPLILPRPQARVARYFNDWFAMHRVKPHVVAEVADAELARRLAISGMGIAPINEHTLAVSPPLGALRRLKLSFGPIRQNLFLITRRSKWMNPIAKQMMEEFRFVSPAPAGARRGRLLS